MNFADFDLKVPEYPTEVKICLTEMSNQRSLERHRLFILGVTKLFLLYYSTIIIHSLTDQSMVYCVT